MNSPSLSRIALVSEVVAWVAGIAIVIALAVSVINSFMGMPIVYVSWSTGECKKVWTPDGEGDCNSLPGTYERIWVK